LKAQGAREAPLSKEVQRCTRGQVWSVGFTIGPEVGIRGDVGNFELDSDVLDLLNSLWKIKV